MKRVAVPSCKVLMVALGSLLSGCQSLGPPEIPVSPDSSVLALDVDFTAHLSGFGRALGRATNSLPFLTGVVFVKEFRHGGPEDTPKLIPASWINGSRAYLFDPEPGTYLVVAVSFALDVSTPATSVSLGGGVSATVSSRGAIGHVVILPASLVQQTRTTIGPPAAEFVGALQIKQGGRINANTKFEDELQRRMAELIRPGATSKSGLAGLSTRTWMADPSESLVSNEASDRKSFLDNALLDFENSPWADVIASLE